MAVIRVTRSDEYINRLRSINIFIDGGHVGEIYNGQEKQFAVSNGIHSVQATIDWCSSRLLYFEINDKEAKTFELSGFSNQWWLMPILLFYYLTFGRNQYLRLQMK